MDAHLQMYSPPPLFWGFVYTAIAGLLSERKQSNEGSKHFTGRIKEPKSFTHNTVKTSKKLPFCSCYSCVFIYILTIFRCQFWSVDFFFQVSKVMRVQALRKMLFICCLPQWSSLLQSWCSLMCLRVCLSLHVVSLSVRIPRPSLSPKRALSCLRMTPPHSSSPPIFFFSYHNTKPVIYHAANFVFHALPQTLLAQSEPVLYRGCADTMVLYATKQCKHPGQALPLVDVCLSFLFKEEVTASFIQFFCNCSRSNGYFILTKSACHRDNYHLSLEWYCIMIEYLSDWVCLNYW